MTQCRNGQMNLIELFQRKKSSITILSKQNCHFIFFTKTENRKAKQVLSGGLDQKRYEEMHTIPGRKGNTNQNHIKIYLIPVRMAIIKNTNNNKCWQGCGEKETIKHY
jgi:hypothetical protein